MDGLEKPAPKEDEAEGRLYREFLTSKPRFSSNEDALAHFTQELKTLETSVGLSASEMFHRWEDNGENNDDYREACSLLAKIAFFKKR